MAGLFDLSTSAASNTSIGGETCAEGQAPSTLNNAIRALAAVVRQSFAAALESFLNGTAPLPLANGGTAATDAATALSNIGGLGSVYRDLVAVSKSAAFTFADSERGGKINYTGAAAAATINPNATTAITEGAVYVIRNSGSGALTITRGSGVTLKKNGSATSADATLAASGVATLIKWGTDDWTVTGSGIS